MDRMLGQDQLRNNDRLQNGNDKQPLRPRSSGNRGQSSQQRPSNNLNKWLVIIVGIMLVIYIYTYFNSTLTASSPSQVELSYSDFYKRVEQKDIRTATFVGSSEITGQLKTPIKGQTQYHVYQL